MDIAIKDLAQLLGDTFKGDGQAKVSNISKIEDKRAPRRRNRQ